MASQPDSQLGMLLHASAQDFSDRHEITCARTDPTHPGCMGTVDAAGILRYVSFSNTGESQVLASCELVMRQAQPPGQDAQWEPVNREWQTFHFLPRGTNKELILCRKQSNKLLFARMPNHPGQVEGVFHFGSHTGAISSFHIQMGGERLISGCEDGVLKLWSMSSGTLMSSNRSAHRGKITAISSLDSVQFVTGGMDGTVLVWDTDGRTVSPVHSLSVACASPVSCLQVFNGSGLIRDGKAVVMPWRRAQSGDPCSECIEEDPPTLIAAGTESGGLYVWACVKDPWVYGKGTTVCRICADHTARGSTVTALGFGQDGSFLAAASSGPRHLAQHMIPDLSDFSEGIVRMYTTDSWSVGEVLRVPAGPPVEISTVGQHSRPVFLMTAPRFGAPLLLSSYFEPERLQDGAFFQLGKPLPEEDPVFLAHCLQAQRPLGPASPAAEQTGAGESIAGDDMGGPAAREASGLPHPVHRISSSSEADHSIDQPRSHLPRHFVPSAPADRCPLPRGYPSSAQQAAQEPPLPLPLAEESEAPRELPAALVRQADSGIVPQASTAGPQSASAAISSDHKVSAIPSAPGRPAGTGRPGQKTEVGNKTRQHVQQQGARQPLAVRSDNYQSRAAQKVAVTRHIQKPPANESNANTGEAQRGPVKPPALSIQPANRTGASTRAPKPPAASAGAASGRVPDAPQQSMAQQGQRDCNVFADTKSSSAKRQPPAPQAPTLAPILPTDTLPECGLLKPRVHSTKLLARKLEALEDEEFPSAEALPAAEAAAGEEAAKRSDPVTGYSELIPVTDEVEGCNPRMVSKQLDAKWVSSRDKKPSVEQLWSIEDHLPGVCSTEPEAPRFHLSREAIAQQILESLVLF